MAGPLDRAYVEITAQLDTRQMQRAITTAGRAVEKDLTNSVRRAERGVSREGTRLGETAGTSFSNGLSDTLSSITSIKLPVAGFAVFGAALAATAASAIQLAAALAPAVGIIAALPSGIGVLAAGMTTLNVATLGVGDAFAAAFGDAEEFEAAMEGLAPSVQAAAQALRDMAPELDALRDRVQDAFFQDFDSVLNQLADTLLGPVSDGMTSVASAMNGVIQGLADVAASQTGIDFVSGSFATMAGIIERLQKPVALLFDALLSVGNAINEAFGAEAGAGLADLITRFAQFLDQAAASGQAVEWVNDALAVFQALGDIISPLVGIIASIGDAAAATGEGILGVFGQVLQTFDDFLASAEGQDVLISLFEALNTVGDAFATVLGNLAPALPPIIEGIGAILSVVAPLLGPLSELVGDVLIALAPILKLVANAIKPLIPPLTTIIELLGQILVDAINTLMPLIAPLLEVFGAQFTLWLDLIATGLEALAPAIGSLLEGLGPLIEALIPLISLFAELFEAVGPVLIPVIQALGEILLWVIEEIINPIVIPVLTFLIELLTVVLKGAVESTIQYFQDAGNGLKLILTSIGAFFSSIIQNIVNGFNILVASLKVAWALINANVFQPIKTGIRAVGTTISDTLTSIRGNWNSFVGFIQGIPSKISSSLRNLFSPLADGFRSAINSVIDGWNGLSFSIPSIDLGSLGSVGGFTVGTPNIPRLQEGGFTTNSGLAMLHPREMVLPLSNANGINALAAAMREAMSSNEASGGSMGDVSFIVQIGERELTDIVVEQVDASNQTMLRRARAGTRRAG